MARFIAKWWLLLVSVIVVLLVAYFIWTTQRSVDDIDQKLRREPSKGTMLHQTLPSIHT